MSGKLSEAISTFYSADAALYDQVSRDRDFDAQVRFLLDVIQPHGRRVLELFAGPAYHARAAVSVGMNVFCIDASSQMRDIACCDGLIPRKNYLQETLPEGLLHLPAEPRFHLVLALRYSLGYLAPTAVTSLFRFLRPHLETKAKIVLELHELSLLRADLQNLEIRERVVPCLESKDDRIVCVWPDGPIAWEREDWIARMRVRVDRYRGSELILRKFFTSREWVHTIGSIRRAVVEVFGRSATVHVITRQSRPTFCGCELVSVECS